MRAFDHVRKCPRRSHVSEEHWSLSLITLTKIYLWQPILFLPLCRFFFFFFCLPLIFLLVFHFHQFYSDVLKYNFLLIYPAWSFQDFLNKQLDFFLLVKENSQPLSLKISFLFNTLYPLLLVLYNFHLIEICHKNDFLNSFLYFPVLCQCSQFYLLFLWAK